MDETLNGHYIRTNADGNIIAGFSDAFRQPEADDILINDQGGYQFHLFPNGEENPTLFTEDGIPLYRYTNGEVRERTQEKIQAQREAMPGLTAMPTQEERLTALEGALIEMVGEMFG